MFDIGFSELFLIAIVALVVLGPERLPKAARFAGLWVRRARAQWYSVKSELERDLAAEELQRSLRDARQTVADLDAGMRTAGEDARREFEAMRRDLARDPGDAPAQDATQDSSQDPIDEAGASMPSEAVAETAAETTGATDDHRR